MEILDAGGESERALEPPPQRAGDLDVDLGHLGDLAAATDDDLLEEPGGTPSAARAALTTLTDAGSLAVSAVLVELITLSGGYQVVAMMGIGLQAEQSQHDLMTEYAQAIGICAATSLLLAVGALFRLRPDAPAWVRAAVGSAVLVGVLMAAVTGYLIWQLAGVTPAAGSALFGTSG